jgi:hypothetical protein
MVLIGCLVLLNPIIGYTIFFIRNFCPTFGLQFFEIILQLVKLPENFSSETDS